MSIHSWGDKNIDWKGINDAAEYIFQFLRRWGHVPVRDHKEKYGTVRVYTGFGVERGWLMNHLFYSNYVYYQFPQWVRKLDYLIPIDWFNFLIRPYHKWLYTQAYRNAVRKWPHLTLEITTGMDHSELLDDWTRLQMVEKLLDLTMERVWKIESNLPEEKIADVEEKAIQSE